jgi:2,3-bisphosphoglycerate-dependent phosphoglycerate mutase
LRWRFARVIQTRPETDGSASALASPRPLPDSRAMNHRSATIASLLVVLLAVACEREPPVDGSSQSEAGRGAAAGDEITLYAVRHAEKMEIEGEDDPPLTPLGEARARALVGAVPVGEVAAVYSSPYVRTRETVAALAEAAGVRVEDVGGHDIAGLVERIGQHRGRAVVVAGHRDTIPQLIAALGVSETVTIGPEDYGELFVVRVGDGGATLERRRFGP